MPYLKRLQQPSARQIHLGQVVTPKTKGTQK